MIETKMYSSDRMDWETPDKLFNELNEEFHFTLDVCANDVNHKCERYFTLEEDGLLEDWAGVCWMNPPYGKEIGSWMKKAYEESLKGVTVVCLTFSRTDTKWFHNWVYGKAELRFIKGRLKFVGAESSAPFPSMLVIYKP